MYSTCVCFFIPRKSLCVLIGSPSPHHSHHPPVPCESNIFQSNMANANYFLGDDDMLPLQYRRKNMQTAQSKICVFARIEYYYTLAAPYKGAITIGGIGQCLFIHSNDIPSSCRRCGQRLHRALGNISLDKAALRNDWQVWKSCTYFRSRLPFENVTHSSNNCSEVLCV